MISVAQRASLLDRLHSVASKDEHSFQKLLTSDERKLISKIPAKMRRDRLRLVVRLLERKTSSEMDALTQTLDPDERDLLAKCFEAHLTSDDHLLHLVKAGVPLYPAVHERVELMSHIDAQPRQSRSPASSADVLVLVGPAGCGKTIVAAEWVKRRQKIAAEDNRPLDVVWTNVSAISNDSDNDNGDDDDGDDVDMERLLSDLLESVLRSRAIGSELADLVAVPSFAVLQDELRRVLDRRRLLLVLDDVRCRRVLTLLQHMPMLIVATTRSRDVAAGLTCATQVVSIPSCSSDEARGILARHCPDRTLLPDCVDSLVASCEGNPTAVATLGLLLRTGHRDVEDGRLSMDGLLGTALVAAEHELEKRDWKRPVDLLDLYADFATTSPAEAITRGKMATLWAVREDEAELILDSLADCGLLLRTEDAIEERSLEELIAWHEKLARRRSVPIERIELLERFRERVLDRLRSCTPTLELPALGYPPDVYRALIAELPTVYYVHGAHLDVLREWATRQRVLHEKHAAWIDRTLRQADVPDVVAFFEAAFLNDRTDDDHLPVAVVQLFRHLAASNDTVTVNHLFSFTCMPRWLRMMANVKGSLKRKNAKMASFLRKMLTIVDQYGDTIAMATSPTTTAFVTERDQFFKELDQLHRKTTHLQPVQVRHLVRLTVAIR